MTIAGKNEIYRGTIWSGYFWYNFWIPDPPPPNPLCSNASFALSRKGRVIAHWCRVVYLYLYPCTWHWSHPFPNPWVSGKDHGNGSAQETHIPVQRLLCTQRRTLVVVLRRSQPSFGGPVVAVRLPFGSFNLSVGSQLLWGRGRVTQGRILCHNFCAKFLSAICSVFLRICTGIRYAVLLLTCTMPEDLVNDT